MKELIAEITLIREQNGFQCPTSIDEVDAMLAKLSLVHSEVSEAVEAVRHGDFENFKEELADTVIRVMDIAGTGGWDLEEEIRLKIAVNRCRSFMHGGKKA